LLTLPPQLLLSIDAGRALVVPDAGVAAAVRLAYAFALADRGRTLWRTPDVVTWSAWLERELALARGRGARMPRVLDATEAWLIWRECALETARGLDTAASDTLVESLRRAAVLAQEWDIAAVDLSRGTHAEAQWLARTIHAFDARCRALEAGTATAIATLLDHRCGAVDLAGFGALTPLQRSIVVKWRAAGSDIRSLESVGPEGRATLARCVDAPQELAAAAGWARARLLAEPQCRLLVIVPELEGRRAVLERAFGSALGSGAEHEPRYAIAAPARLEDAPVVRHLLTALRLMLAPLDFELVSAWLRGPCWREPAMEERARLDRWRGEHLGVLVGWRDLVEALAAAPAALSRPAARLRAKLTAFETALEASRPAQPGAWSARIAAAWRTLGTADAEESGTRAAYHRCLESLNELAVLDASAGVLTFVSALEWLGRFISRSSFDPARGDPAVTITDAFTDPIVRYDGIWVCDLRSAAWPRAVRRDPFVPAGVQIAAGMPFATAAGRLAEGRALLGAWRRATDELLLSWPASADDCEQAPSVLLDELPGVTRIDAPQAVSAARIVHASRLLESYEDRDGAPWEGGQALPSGARSVDYQIRCAFRAYAELRLTARPLERPRPGLDPRERGRLVHRVLELTWRELVDSEGLAARRGKALDAVIERAALAAGAELLADRPGEDRARAVHREARRAARLARSLCEAETERAPFTVVEREVRHAIDCGGVGLHVRIDRIDRLADGSLALVDYKTGEPRKEDWFGARPSQPQLLVYLRAMEEGTVAALANAHLTVEGTTFRGVADAAGRLPRVAGLGSRDAWRGQVRTWRGIVEQAVHDFVHGRALRDPIEGACEVCHLRAVCRIGDATAADSAK
jgi:ATP-dependent helicase/nuclease subunit B